MFAFWASNNAAFGWLQADVEFSWSDDQRQGYQQAREFAERELRLSRETVFTADSFRLRWRRCARFGIQALNTPVAYGGLGLDTRSAVHVLEGLGRGSDDNGLLMALGAQLWSVAVPLLTFGGEGQKSKWLPLLAQGSAIGAFALTEPEAGSDAFHLHTHALPDRAGYRLQGAKAFISNAPVADLFLVFATTEKGAGYFGLTAFLVERDRPGLSIGPALHKMGLESSPMADLHCDDVWVPGDAVLGDVGGGGAVLSHTLEWERGCLLAPALGTIGRLLETTAAYTRARKQFGRPIIEFEAVGALLAEIRLRLQLARLLVYQFAWRKDQGMPAALESSMVKLYLSESLRRASELALHLHGASGYMREFEFERTWRDAMASSLFSGTTEMQYNLIAETLLRPQPARRPLASPLEVQP